MQRENLHDSKRSENSTRGDITLSAFQRECLRIIGTEPKYGLAIKRELEERYGEEVNHGRLYPNLDQLVEAGLVAKSELDKRTNQYALTDEGYELLVEGAEAYLEDIAAFGGHHALDLDGLDVHIMDAEDEP